ncbi:MAG: DUF1874 domain-containing protein [Candidatus Aenigmatarchaeota archaeon]
MLYILNSAVITTPGKYSYRLIDREYAIDLLASNQWISTIGYESTAKAMSELVGMEIPLNRVTIRMKAGDIAIVFRIVLPEGAERIDPKDKGQLNKIIDKGWWELGLLEKLSE